VAAFYIYLAVEET